MNILVTGSGGYLGSVLCPMLEKKGHTLIKLDLGLFGVGEYTKFDLSLDSLLKYKVTRTNKIDTIIHLAGISNDPASEINYGLTERMNIQASIAVIKFALANQITRFIFTSSASVYGVSKEPSKENYIPNPLSAYAESKVRIEDILLSKRYTGMNMIILRFGTLFGLSPKNRFDLAINLMAKDAAINDKIRVFGDGNQYRPFLGVEDAARSIIHALDYDSSILTNVITENIKIVDLANMLSDLFKVSVEFTKSNNDNRDYKLDDKIMRNEFCFSPSISIETGAKEIYKWATLFPNSVDNDIYYTIKMWKKFYKEYVNV